MLYDRLAEQVQLRAVFREVHSRDFDGSGRLRQAMRISFAWWLKGRRRLAGDYLNLAVSLEDRMENTYGTYGPYKSYVANPVIVTAAVILTLGELMDGPKGPGRMASLDDGRLVFLTDWMLARYTPTTGDYFVTQADGYEYVNPKDVFNRKYRPFTGMDFGDAIRALNGGMRVRRSGWNGKGMWLGLQSPDSQSKMKLPYIYMSTVTGDLVPWLASQTDMLATDWEPAE